MVGLPLWWQDTGHDFLGWLSNLDECTSLSWLPTIRSRGSLGSAPPFYDRSTLYVGISPASLASYIGSDDLRGDIVPARWCVGIRSSSTEFTDGLFWCSWEPRQYQVEHDYVRGKTAQFPTAFLLLRPGTAEGTGVVGHTLFRPGLTWASFVRFVPPEQIHGEVKRDVPSEGELGHPGVSMAASLGSLSRGLRLDEEEGHEIRGRRLSSVCRHMPSWLRWGLPIAKHSNG
ncbi:hypothetical protein R1flu_019501 [Riccia fluitans]|uniref:Uncharacterized protein n=1 Tax=Riccia fluitans TaxID=41844 RepID=A0ABD1ZIV1_9MARC